MPPESQPLPVSKPQKRAGLLRQVLGNRMAAFGIGLVLFFVLIALLAPVIAPGSPDKFAGKPNQPPSAEFLLGTTHLGKDVFKQTVWGARSSLLVGFGTALFTTLIAIVIGMSSAYFRGLTDDLLTLVMNLFLVIPGLPLLIILSGYLRPSTATVIFVLTLTGWAFAARIVRSQTLMLREKDFVAAAKVSGDNDFRIIFHEILPNMTSIIVGLTVSGVAYGIGAATALSFLGLTDISEVTWGTNLYESAESTELMQTPAHPYTQLLLSAVPNSQAGLTSRTVQARGEVPSLVDPPPGCPFAARCPKVMDVCRQAMPGRTTIADGHWVNCHLYQNAPTGEANDRSPITVH